MAALGLIGLAATALLPALRDSPLGRWILSETLAPASVLPLLGFGVLLSIVGKRSFGVGSVLFGLGIVAGLVAEDHLLRILDTIPRAATHLFMTGPISYLAVGAALVIGTRLRPWLTPIAAAIFGAMLGLVIKLTDPSLHDPVYTWTPVLIACWIVAAMSLTLRAFRRSWFPIFARILGSWLLAIGLLYGAASLVPRRAPPSLPPPSRMPGPSPDIPLRQP